MKATKTFILGNNVDRKLLDGVQDKINNDYDIKRLIYKVKYGMILKVFWLGFSLFMVLFNYRKFSIDKPAFGVISLLVFASSLIGIVSDIGSIKELMIKIPGYIKYIFNKKSPSHPSDLWRHLQGSVADIQMYNSVKGILDNEDVKVKYAGVPYYSTEYIDYITIRWIPNKKRFFIIRFFDMVKTRLRYMRFFRDYAQKTYFSKADNKYFKNENKMIERSNAIFGILFSSKYLFSELSKQNNPFISSVDIKINEKVKDHDYRVELAREWMKCCLNPHIVKPNKYEKQVRYSLKVVDISYGVEDKKWNMWRDLVNFFTPNIHIPIKKFIAIPKSDNSSVKTNGERDIYICIGGAEQNMALQTFINKYRWRNFNHNFVCENSKIGTGSKELVIGFAENIFDNRIQADFLAGTEGLVYGIREDVLGRLSELDCTSYKAEVFRMKLSDEITVFSVYGFSAMATKMALCQLCNSIREDTAELKQFVPGKNSISTDIIDYCLVDLSNDPKTIFTSPEGKYWDENDLMNDKQKLKAWLDDSITEDKEAQNHITTS